MVDIQPQSEQTAEDQELASMLAGITDTQSMDAPVQTVGNLSPTGDMPELPPLEAPAMPEMPAVDPLPTPELTQPAPEMPVPAMPPMPSFEAPAVATPAPMTGSLDTIKTSILSDLRPIVGKLNLPPEERFDAYLLLIQSADDQEFIQPAYDAAREIADETKRAEALLKIIKEIEDLTKA